MSAAHWSWLMAPVPESVRRSSSTSLAASWKTFQPAASSARSRSSRVVERMGSTILIRNGSRGGRIGRASVWQVLPAAQEGRHFEYVRGDVEVAPGRLALGFDVLALTAVAAQGAVEAGGDHRHSDLPVHVLVDHGAEDNVRVQVGCARHDLGGLVDLEEAEI